MSFHFGGLLMKNKGTLSLSKSCLLEIGQGFTYSTVSRISRVAMRLKSLCDAYCGYPLHPKLLGVQKIPWRA